MSVGICCWGCSMFPQRRVSGVFTTEKEYLTVTHRTASPSAQGLRPVTAKLLGSLGPAQPD